MKRILCIDGGGLMGIIPAVFLQILARALAKQGEGRLWKVFDLMAGSSTGAILTGAIASGVTAERISYVYRHEGVRLFEDHTYRNWRARRPKLGKFRREDFAEAFKPYLPGVMGDLKTRYMATGVSLCDSRTHYFKSDDRKPPKNGKGPCDADLSVLEVVSRSGLSAPYYFEPVDDPVGQQVWVDGGTGTQNCPFEECVIEAVQRHWHTRTDVRILSLGTGHSDPRRAYKKAAKRQSWRTVTDYLTIARKQSVPDQFHRWEKGWKPLLAPAVRVKRVDLMVPARVNTLDGPEHAALYTEYGKQLAEEHGAAIARFLKG